VRQAEELCACAGYHATPRRQPYERVGLLIGLAYWLYPSLPWLRLTATLLQHMQLQPWLNRPLAALPQSPWAMGCEARLRGPRGAKGPALESEVRVPFVGRLPGRQLL